MRAVLPHTALQSLVSSSGVSRLLIGRDGRRLVRKKSLKALKDKLRRMAIRSRGDSLERIISDLNPMLRGWFGHFQHATPALFGVLRRLYPPPPATIRASRKSAPAVGGAEPATNAGPMLSSRLTGYSPCAGSPGTQIPAPVGGCRRPVSSLGASMHGRSRLTCSRLWPIL